MNVLLSWEERSDAEFRSFELGRRLTTFHFCAAPDPRRTDRSQLSGQISNQNLVVFPVLCFYFLINIGKRKFWFCSFLSIYVYNVNLLVQSTIKCFFLALTKEM